MGYIFYPAVSIQREGRLSRWPAQRVHADSEANWRAVPWPPPCFCASIPQYPHPLRVPPWTRRWRPLREATARSRGPNFVSVPRSVRRPPIGSGRKLFLRKDRPMPLCLLGSIGPKCRIYYRNHDWASPGFTSSVRTPVRGPPPRRETSPVSHMHMHGCLCARWGDSIPAQGVPQ